MPTAGAQAGAPKRKIKALSEVGLPVMIYELAVGVQRKLPHQNIVAKENSYLGLRLSDRS
jgi:glyoxylate carboligase